jgi:glycosyltransferase involved in cell wall biosynthesis
MPVVALATTEAPEAVPPGTGYCGTDPARLAAAVRDLVADPGLARETGLAARTHALARYGLDRFLADWDDLLATTVAEHRTDDRRSTTGTTVGGRS